MVIPVAMKLEQKAAVVCHLIGILIALRVDASVSISTSRDAVVQRGATTTLRCSTNSSQAIAISWYNSSRCRVVPTDKNCSMRYDETADPSTRVHVTRFENEYDLNISQIELTDAGTYVCLDEISHVYGVTHLTVVDGPPHCTLHNHTGPVTSQNGSLSLTCQFTFAGSDATPLTLTKNNQSLAIGDSTGVTWTGPASINDTFVCQAAFGYQTHCPGMHVTPPETGAFGHGPPLDVRVVPLRNEYSIGDLIRCSALGSHPIKYHWHVSKISTVIRGPELRVSENMVGHAVEFLCVAENHHGKDRMKIVARVIGITAVVHDITFYPWESEYKAGDSITCKAEGYPKPTFSWRDKGNVYSASSGSDLHITENMVGSDFTYHCTATNYVNGRHYEISKAIRFKVTSGKHVSVLSIVVVIGVIVVIIVALVLWKKKIIFNSRGSSNHSTSRTTVGRSYSRECMAASVPFHGYDCDNEPHPVSCNVYSDSGFNQSDRCSVASFGAASCGGASYGGASCGGGSGGGGSCGS